MLERLDITNKNKLLMVLKEQTREAVVSDLSSLAYYSRAQSLRAELASAIEAEGQHLEELQERLSKAEKQVDSIMKQYRRAKADRILLSDSDDATEINGTIHRLEVELEEAMSELRTAKSFISESESRSSNLLALDKALRAEKVPSALDLKAALELI